MKKRLFLATILIIISFFSPAPAVAQSEDQPVVRAVLFYLPTCPHCHKIIQEVLPIMQDHYGDQLEVVAIN
ncbi:MAG: thioredoxin family protein, partial [Anaerolineae bacterium]|nr:thioredoxin family protein [Anaerolineae bacterium]